MASNVTAKDKKQIKVLGIIVAALLVVLVVVLVIPAPKKQYTQEQMAALAVKYVAENNYIAGDAKWPDLDDWQVRSENNSYAASCRFRLRTIAASTQATPLKVWPCTTAMPNSGMYLIF